VIRALATEKPVAIAPGLRSVLRFVESGSTLPSFKQLLSVKNIRIQPDLQTLFGRAQLPDVGVSFARPARLPRKGVKASSVPRPSDRRGSDRRI
jgi:hypothetical protein